MTKYLFLHTRVTIVEVSGNTKIIKNTKKGTKVVKRTKTTLIAAIIAIKAIFCTNVSLFVIIIKEILTFLKIFWKNSQNLPYILCEGGNMNTFLKIALLGLSSISLSSCNTQTSNHPNLSSYKTYEDFENLHITLHNSLNLSDDKYYVYVYSRTCSPCEQIKTYIFELASSMENLYFLEYVDNLEILNEDMSLLIGVSDYNDLFIKGTPSLFDIEKGKVVFATSGKTNVINHLFSEYNNIV